MKYLLLICGNEVIFYDLIEKEPLEIQIYTNVFLNTVNQKIESNNIFIKSNKQGLITQSFNVDETSHVSCLMSHAPKLMSVFKEDEYDAIYVYQL